MKRDIGRISESALKRLETYDWPGNVRELENAMERAFILETSKELTDAFLPDGSANHNGSFKVVADLPADGIDLETYVENLQKGFLEEALRRSNGVQVKAAQLLRMSYRSFRHYLQKYSIPS
jgi:two-component system response regulator PilR (NtrC family)